MCPSPVLKVHVPAHTSKDELFWAEVVLFWLLLNAPEGDFEKALLTWIKLSHSFISPACWFPPFFFFFLWKYPVTVYALHAVYAAQPMKNTWRVPRSFSPQLHKSCIAFCMAAWLHGVMGSSLPTAPALGPQHPLGILALQPWTLPGWHRRGEVQSLLSPIFILLDRKISPSYCLAALQCLQHSHHLALQFVSVLLQTRVMQRILPWAQLVKHSQELVLAIQDAAVHWFRDQNRGCAEEPPKTKSGMCLRTHSEDEVPYLPVQVNLLAGAHEVQVPFLGLSPAEENHRQMLIWNLLKSWSQANLSTNTDGICLIPQLVLKMEHCGRSLQPTLIFNESFPMFVFCP